MTVLYVLAGAFLGAMAGGMIGDDEAAFVGGIAGAIIGWLLRRRPAAATTDARIDALTAEVRELGAAIELLRARMRVLEGDATATAPHESPAPAPAAAAADAPPAPGDTAIAASPETPEPFVDAPGDPPLSSPWGAPGSATPAWLRAVLGWFTGGNTVVRVGVVVLFFGVAFLLKYAWEHARVPPEFRVGGAMLGGIALAVLGWRLRRTRAGYAVALQGGGIGVMYLAIFAALRLYQLLPPTFAFVLLALVAVFAAALALLQNAQSLALLGTAGGFLAPVLASTGGGDPVALFGYYTVLNLGIVAIASRRAWRPLNLLGFAFTFAIAAAWGARDYDPAQWPRIQPFLAAFFLMYLAIPTFFARASDQRLARGLDGTLVFGVPIVAFALQVRLVSHFTYGAALSALAVAALYLVAARHVHRRDGAALPLLAASFAALSLVFATLVIPLAFDARWTAAAWALEGAALVWVGLAQARWLVRAAGYVLQLAAAVTFIDGLSASTVGLPVLNRDCLGFALLTAAGAFSSLQLHRRRERIRPWETIASTTAFVAACGWWLAGGLREIDAQVAEPWQGQAVLLFFTATAIGAELLPARLAWPAPRALAHALLPLATMALLLQMHAYAHPFSHGGFIAWPLAFGVHAWILRRREPGDGLALDLLHGAAQWLLVLVAGWELAWAAERVTAPGADWPLAALALPAAGLLAFLATRGARLPWPTRAHPRGVLLFGAGPVVVVLLAWLLLGAGEGSGTATPLPYVPLLNPLDLAVAAALLAVLLWSRTVQAHPFGGFIARRAWLRFGVPGAVGFVAANGMLLRGVHQYAAVPVALVPVMHSMVAQAALSLFWTLLALSLTVLAHRLRHRLLWLTGAALLGATVLKLFLVDLSNAGGVERIVSFVGVGLLMLAIGWFAPVPPRDREAAA